MSAQSSDTFSSLLDRARAASARGEAREAARLAKKAAGSVPEDAKAWHDLGLACIEFGIKDEAESALQRSLEIAPSPHAYGQLATLYEKANELNNAWATATLGLKMFPDDPLLSLAMARCERRAGKAAQAFSRLKGAVEKTENPLLRTQMLFQLGAVHDQLGDVDKAFAAYTEAKREAAGLGGAEADPDVPLRFIRKMTGLELKRLPRFSADMGTGDRPKAIAFLIGFPRSGTTLLNQVLDSHPGIVTLEEKPALALSLKPLEAWGKPYPEGLPGLTAAEVGEMRKTYLAAAHEFAEFGEDQVLVDKLPLNLIHLPLALALFPDAKIILALRHPLGCALSCFMHSFRPNNAMVHMLSLDDITGLYRRVMDLWQKFSDEGAFSNHQVRYENVVGDLEGEAKKLCRFLNVEWSPAMLQYHRHARAKGLINTPSYHQVVQPLYADSTERWRRYHKHLAPYAERLAPYAERFGYSL